MAGISAVIITLNEASSIERCLISINGLVDEIIVVDSYSKDNTGEICKKYNAKYFQHEFTGFMDQKNYAMTLASNKFVLSLDADEALSPELFQTLTQIKNNLRFDGYLFNRSNNFCGQWIRHSAWYPDRQLRLFNKEKGKWGTINVHEKFKMSKGSMIKQLKGDLFHWPYASVDDYKSKMESYSAIAAREYYKTGKKVYFVTPFLHMAWRFLLNYFFHFGFLDGRNGYIVCSLGARSSYLKYSGLRKLHKKEKLAKSREK